MKPQPYTIKLPGTSLVFEASAALLLYPIVLIGLFVWFFLEVQQFNFWPFFVLVLTLALVRLSPLLRRAASPMRKLRPKLQLLAATNQLRAYKKRRPVATEHFYPSIQDLGWRGRDEFGCKGVVNGIPTDLYLHTYRSRTRSDTDRVEVFVIRCTLPVLLPHTVLQRRNKQRSVLASTLERSFDDNQRVTLQGDLDDFFFLYTHRRTVTDALTVWSPQLLEKMKDLQAAVSIETIGKDVYVYLSPGYRPFDLSEVIEFTNTLVRSLQRTTRTDFLELPNSAKYPYLRSRPSGGVVRIAGQHYSVATALLAISLGIHFLFALQRGTTLGYIIFGIMTTVIVGLAVTLRLLRNKYTRQLDKRGH